jgi:Spy/CpxP family protein refolding chaperone
MKNTLFAAIVVLLFGALTSIGLAAPDQPAQPPAAGPGMTKMAKPENRMIRISRGLNLTEEQKAKIKPILEDESAKVNSVLEDSTLSRQQKRVKIREIHAATFEQIKPILTPEQLKKHEEMMKSGKGMRSKMPQMTPANRLQGLSAALDLTEEQKAKIKPILEDESAKVKSALEDTKLSRQQKRAKVREIHAATFEQIKPVLTPEQLKKHEQMMKQWKK